jgi:hypothetical protein
MMPADSVVAVDSMKKAIVALGIAPIVGGNGTRSVLRKAVNTHGIGAIGATVRPETIV